MVRPVQHADSDNTDPRPSRDEVVARKAARTAARKAKREPKRECTPRAEATADTFVRDAPLGATSGYNAAAFGEFAVLPEPVVVKVAQHAGAMGWLQLGLVSKSFFAVTQHLGEIFFPDLVQATLLSAERISDNLKYSDFRLRLANIKELCTPEGLTTHDLQRLLNACPALERLTLSTVQPYHCSVPKLRLPKTLRHLSLPPGADIMYAQQVRNPYVTSVELRGDAFNEPQSFTRD